MKVSMRRQRGIGFIGVFFLLAVGGFFLIVAVKLGPHYMQYLTVRSVMQDLTEDPSLIQGGAKAVSTTIERRLYINDVRNLSPKAFKLKRMSGGFLLSVDYKVQEHLLGNVDVVMAFTYEVPLIKK